MVSVNVATCDLDELLERGAFRCEAFTVTERLGGVWVGATVYEVGAGDKRGPYHYHHGVEEWMYVISGAPIHRDVAGERALEPGDLVAFAAGPHGAHTLSGPGRVVIFSTGSVGWGEAFVTVYPDSDKIGAAPGVKFRRADAVDVWHEEPSQHPEPPSSAFGSGCPVVNLMSAATGSLPLGAQTWCATLWEVAPGEATGAYHYEWCRETWALVVAGALTVRRAEGEDVLAAGDLLCFPQGPEGARRLINHAESRARLITFTTPIGRPLSAFYPDDDAVVIRIPGADGFRFRLADRIHDYWDGEPGAAPAA